MPGHENQEPAAIGFSELPHIRASELIRSEDGTGKEDAVG